MDNVNLIVCAVVFGATESLLGVSLGNGYSFVKKCLISKELCEIFDVSNVTDLSWGYFEAKIDNSYNVICVYKSQEININMSDERQLDKIFEQELAYLDEKFRALRLYKETFVRFKKVRMKATSNNSYSYKTTIPYGDGLYRTYKPEIDISSDEKSEVDDFLLNFLLPPTNCLNKDILLPVLLLYDVSYHQQDSISFTMLMTALETLILLKDEFTKKEKIAKRVSLLLYQANSDVLMCYDRLKLLYKKRSEFIHEGNMGAILQEDVIALREYVRKTILIYMKSSDAKADIIKKLKDKAKIVWSIS